MAEHATYSLALYFEMDNWWAAQSKLITEEEREMFEEESMMFSYAF